MLGNGGPTMDNAVEEALMVGPFYLKMRRERSGGMRNDFDKTPKKTPCRLVVPSSRCAFLPAALGAKIASGVTF
jgi:hypothetical protein